MTYMNSYTHTYIHTYIHDLPRLLSLRLSKPKYIKSELDPIRLQAQGSSAKELVELLAESGYVLMRVGRSYRSGASGASKGAKGKASGFSGASGASGASGSSTGMRTQKDDLAEASGLVYERRTAGE